MNVDGKTAEGAEKVKKTNRKAQVLTIIEDHTVTIEAIEYEQGISVPKDVITKSNLNECVQACAAAKEVLVFIESEVGGPD